MEGCSGIRYNSALFVFQSTAATTTTKNERQRREDEGGGRDVNVWIVKEGMIDPCLLRWLSGYGTHTPCRRSLSGRACSSIKGLRHASRLGEGYMSDSVNTGSALAIVGERRLQHP